ncbi:MAG: DNA alkylation repair protein, partial [Ruminiclostridium sp.]|nr:DNA alkylation repair protein [Ruminiclostridium sp.]
MNTEEITAELFRMRDTGYAQLQRKIIPTVAPERIIGVRTPELRAFAKRLRGDEDTELFLEALPHRYFDEDQLHAFIISLEKDPAQCAAQVRAFLPFIDNWATCDQLSPKAFGKIPGKLLEDIRVWIRSDSTYTV